MFHSIDESLVSRSGVLKTERHYFVTVSSSISDERSPLLIIRMRHDLIVARECIHESQELISGSQLNESIDMRERITVFWAMPCSDR